MRFLPLLAAGFAFAVNSFGADSTVIFNEIHYQPIGGQEEFIEFRNLNGVDVSIAGWKITGGVDFTFPAGTVVPGGGYLVVSGEEFSGQLSNGGETLQLRNLNGRIMDEVTYDDEGEWPLGADGSGATLSRRAANAAQGPAAWAASTAVGGTPGAENFAAFGPIDRTLIASRASWKYRDADAAPPANWADPAFSDATWTQGNAVLGTPGGAPTLLVTADLVERFRASAITGVANGGIVATWLDGATGDGVSQNAVAGTSNPTLRTNITPSGKSVVRFDGNDEERTTVATGIAPTGGFTYFIVLKGNVAQTNGGVGDGAGSYIFDRSVGGNPLASLKAVNGSYGFQKRYNDGSAIGGPVATTPISTTAFQIVAARRNRTQSRFELWVNGVMEGTDADTGGALTPDPINIGRHASVPTQGFNGDIAEILIYKSELTDADFQSVGAYLESEYGLDTAFSGTNVATPLSVTAPTSYFRKTFTSPGNAALTTLRLSHLVADGAVFYLNGAEILRTNMPGGAIAHGTPASSIITAPASSGAIPVPAASLVSGTNVLAVSLHKALASPGVLFDATLESTEAPSDPNVNQLRFNEFAAAGSPAFYVELRNPTASAVSTSGWIIKSSDGQSVALPAQNIPTGGYVAFSVTDLGFTPANGARLFLFAPGGFELRDSQAVANQLRGLLPDGRWGQPDSATPGAPNIATINSAIVINEIFYHAADPTPPALPSGEQWIELYNKSAAPVDVSLWKLSDGIDYQFPAATPAIPAGGYVVVAWDPATFATLHSGVTARGPFNGSLSGKGETITLRDVNDNVADQVTYADGGRWSQWADGGGSSLELIDPDADNSKGEAWDASDESSRSTWQNVTVNGTAALNPGNNPTDWHEFVFGLLDAGEMLIDDISVKDVTQGNIELIQNRDFTSGNTNTWRIIGTHSGTVVPDPTAPGNNVLKVTATAETEHMHNNAGTSLKNGASFHNIVASDIYNITFRAKWLRGSNALHSRLYVNRLPRKTLLNRPTTGGTPGAQNSRFVANIGPTFDALAHAPVVPPATVAATVSVKVADADGIGSVQLFQSINGAAFTNGNMTSADGQTYTGTVSGQNSGTLVQFYIRATDSLGAVSFFPPGGVASRAMIPWADGRALLTLPSGAKPHNVRVVMPGVDANNLYRHENLMSNAPIPCTVIYDEKDVYYRAAVELKSSEHGRFNIGRVGYNLDFPPDDLFLGTHAAVSVDRSGGLGPGQKEILVKTLSILAGGIHAPQDDIIRLIPARATGTGYKYDGSGMLGAAILSKTRLKDDYLDGQWENGGDGMMFKYERVYVQTQTINPVTRVEDVAIVRENPKIPQDFTGPPGVYITNLLGTSEVYRWHWLVEGGRDRDDYTGIMNVANAVGQTVQTNFNSLVSQYIDVDAWTRAHVPAVLYGVIDNYLGAGGRDSQHNVLVYFPPGKKAVLFPWDMDYLDQSATLAEAATLATGGDISKFIANPAWKRLYYGNMLDVLNRSFNSTTITQWATHYSRFGTDDMVGTANSYLIPRAAYAFKVMTGTGGQTAPIPFVVFARTSASPVTVSTPFATVTGVGWINVAEVRLAGSPEPLALTWTGQSNWSVQIPVSNGTRMYTLIPYDRNGMQVGNTATGGTPVTTSVIITGTGGVLPAAPGNIVVSEINYHPAGTADTEFIELLNITGNTLELGGCHFDEESGEGISYAFPAGTQIGPGARILVVSNTSQFNALYGSGLPVALGNFTGGLDNGGESIVLYSAAGLEIFRFSYSDNIASTDGGGRSLVRKLSSTNPNPSTYAWRESTQNNGNPNATDAVLFTGSPLVDLDLDGCAAIIEYVSGTSDNNPASRPAAPQFMFDLAGNVTVTFPIVPNADDAIATTQTSTSPGGGWVPHLAPVPASANRFFRLSVAPR